MQKPTQCAEVSNDWEFIEAQINNTLYKIEEDYQALPVREKLKLQFTILGKKAKFSLLGGLTALFLTGGAFYTAERAQAKLADSIDGLLYIPAFVPSKFSTTREAAPYYTINKNSSITPEVAGKAYQGLAFPAYHPLDEKVVKVAQNISLPHRGDVNIAEAYQVLLSQKVLTKALPVLAPVKGKSGKTPSVTEQDIRRIKLIASAPGIDILGERYTDEVENLSFWELPYPRLNKIREASYVLTAHAALQAESGKYKEAERTLLEIYSFGALISENAPVTIESFLGSIIAFNAIRSLAGLYNVSGEREKELLALSTVNSSDQQKAAGESYRKEKDSTTPHEWAKQAIHFLNMPEIPRSVRWEIANTINMERACGMHEALQTSTAKAIWDEAAKHSLGIYESERATLNALLETETHMDKKVILKYGWVPEPLRERYRCLLYNYSGV